jgi:hypothetical protein
MSEGNVQQAYKLKSSSEITDAPAGTIVWEASGYDYGLAADDTRATGIEHVSVTLNRSGGSPFFTHPKHDLEPADVEPLPALTDDHVTTVCRPGEAGCCRYLTVGASGWACQKHTALASEIDFRVKKNAMKATGDNCEGRSAP